MAAQSYAQLAIISKLQAKMSSLQTSLAKQSAKTQAAEASICKLEEAKTATEGLLALAEARGKASVMRADLAEADAAAILITLAQAGAAEEIAKKKAADALVEVASSKAALFAADVVVAKERASREEAEALLAKAHLVILGLKKEAVATLVSPIILQDSAIDLAEPRSVPACSPGFDLSQFCWCDEGWHCMCGLPDAN